MTTFLFPSQLREKKSIGDADRAIPVERRRQLHKAIFNAIVRDGRPFNDFSKPGLRDFLTIAVPNYRPPHRTTIRRYLAAQYAEHRKVLRAILPNVGSIALTTDLWKSGRRMHFLCITAHCFTDDFECVPLIIGFRRFSGRHLGSRIRLYIEHELDSLGVDRKCIVAITTDNGSDVKLATGFGFGQRMSCLAHNIHLIITNGLSLWRKPDHTR